MDNLKIVGAPLPDMPWEDRPEGSKEVLWRYSKNPVIPRDILPTSNSVFNSAVVPFKGGYAGVFRCDDTNRRMRLHVGFSADAIHWSISETKLEFEVRRQGDRRVCLCLRPPCMFYRGSLLCDLV